MEFTRITDLQDGEKYTGIYALIEKADKKYASNGSMYLDIVLQDRTGSINSKKWDASEEEAETFTAGNIVKFGGHCGSYRENLQFTIKTIELHNSMDIGHFLPSAPIERDDLHEKIENFILDISNSSYKRIVKYLLNKFEADFYVYPAASRNHHEYVSGLAHHVYCMLKLGEQICELYPLVDKSLLYAGIILHDIGKVKELSGNISTTYTFEGKLLGHITIATMEVEKAAMDLNITGNEVVLLQHLILSHHGKMEYGSPKLPQLREAEVLSFIDNFDSRMNMIDKELSDVEPQSFSKRVRSMEGRQFYKQ
jgi:3'-5' exoribonuclease